ncbi:hypothetical protein [Burkholderia contaminans]|uniref:hypothetical protein n=1 Tax=Burkholderia contaminans TaxID=488447 RepID=UPI000CFF40A6|nr:hypothetical protein [Burkholderia contaminans]PRD92318.1 hypothetical protein C6P88_16840 [Burkholderia contaminans]
MNSQFHAAPAAVAEKGHPLNEAQRDALQQLKAACTAATDSDLFVELVGYCTSPDSINDVCDALVALEA